MTPFSSVVKQTKCAKIKYMEIYGDYEELPNTTIKYSN